MRTFDEIFESDLKPLLEEFEVQRLTVKAKIVKVSLICLGVAIAISITVLAAEFPPPGIFFAVLLSAMIGFFLVNGDIKEYSKAFKREVVARVVSAIDPGLSFNANGYITESQYMSCRIFLKDPDRYKGEDLVEGTINKTAIRFSEIHSEYKTHSTDSKGNRQTHWHTIFDGVFFIADFNKNFSQDTVILPDRAEKLLGRFGKMFQKMNFRQEKLVTLEDPEFEKLFAVYADDETEARYILSPALMQRLMEFRRKTGDIYVSFTGSNVNVAVPTKRNLFEPRLMKSVVDPTLVGEYYKDVEFFVGIVEDLNLNNRIWTKE